MYLSKLATNSVENRQVTEITSRRVAEKKSFPRRKIKQMLRLYDRALTATSNGIVIADATQPDCPLIYCNPGFEELTGYSQAEVIGSNCRFLQGLDTDPEVIAEIRTCLQQKKDCTVIVKNYRKDGTPFWNELTISPVRDSKGETTHFIGVQNNITERKLAEEALQKANQQLEQRVAERTAALQQANEILKKEIAERKRVEAALRESEARFRAIFERAALGIALIDLDGRPVVSNPALQEMLGYSSAELGSMTFAEFTHPNDVTNDSEEYQQLVTGKKENYQKSKRYYRKDRQLVWGNLNISLVRDSQGKPQFAVGMVENITQRKQAEVALHKALLKEKELSELKSKVISITSHEFRTPLTTILSSTELLENYRQQWNEAKKLKHIQRIKMMVNQMTRVLDDLLLLGKNEAGKLRFTPQPLDLVSFCYQTIEALRLSIGSRHLLDFSFEQKREPTLIDERLLRYILSNLFANAIKYSPEGSTINFELGCQDNWVVLRVQDRGIGIPQQDLDRLFDSFHRAGNVGDIEGSGLGLAIAKTCVDLHQGKIAVESQVGVGTTVTVSLPLNPHQSGQEDFFPNEFLAQEEKLARSPLATANSHRE
ncbi:MAG: PAS domain S-box protein [Oscillatoria sp. PMC 1068.18]|nr:PAS domain S-box protein [Oscillatoria sp. PMC 1076.18]MEC4990162.1 PAS domain S-box protein [Oscillatoria sp. PMC 1068.18]